MSAVDLTVQQLWVPGHGLVPPHIRTALDAVQHYDANLSLGRHEQTGEWVVLLKRPDGETQPILGLGTELPSEEAISKKLYESDVRRHGAQIIERLNRIDREQKAATRKAASDGSAAVAEGFEWGYRKLGARPNTKIFVPSGAKL